MDLGLANGNAPGNVRDICGCGGVGLCVSGVCGLGVDGVVVLPGIILSIYRVIGQTPIRKPFLCLLCFKSWHTAAQFLKEDAVSSEFSGHLKEA